jgi:hypothetical protein
MDNNTDALVDAIRAALADGASMEARAAGATACQMVLAALTAKPGEPLASTPPTSTPIQSAVAALRNAPPEQLLDFAIAKLKAALPPGTSVPPVQRISLPLLPISSLRGKS